MAEHRWKRVPEFSNYATPWTEGRIILVIAGGPYTAKLREQATTLAPFCDAAWDLFPYSHRVAGPVRNIHARDMRQSAAQALHRAQQHRTPRLNPCSDKGPAKNGCDALSPHVTTKHNQALHRPVGYSPATER